MAIQELSDFPALQQLARALWREGTTRGAAVLVGSGFSRNAVLSGGDTPEPPLWSMLCQLMAEELYRDPSAAPMRPTLPGGNSLKLSRASTELVAPPRSMSLFGEGIPPFRPSTSACASISLLAPTPLSLADLESSSNWRSF
jgi:hypothetical protein